jgi:hypothetical protein
VSCFDSINGEESVSRRREGKPRDAKALVMYKDDPGRSIVTNFQYM